MTALSIQINNAGLGIPKKRLNKHGFELTLATNHYGHFILTALLIGKLDVRFYL